MVLTAPGSMASCPACIHLCLCQHFASLSCLLMRCICGFIYAKIPALLEACLLFVDANPFQSSISMGMGIRRPAGEAHCGIYFFACDSGTAALALAWDDCSRHLPLDLIIYTTCWRGGFSIALGFGLTNCLQNTGSDVVRCLVMCRK